MLWWSERPIANSLKSEYSKTELKLWRQIHAAISELKRVTISGRDRVATVARSNALHNLLGISLVHIVTITEAWVLDSLSSKSVYLFC